MNILVVNYEFPPLGGGAGNATYNLLKYLSRKSDINTSLLFGTDSRYGTFPKIDRIKMYPINHKRKGIHDAGMFGMAFFLFKAHRYIKEVIAKDKIELIHYFFSIPTGLLTLFSSGNIPYIVSLRGGDVPGFNVGQLQLMHNLLKPINMYIWHGAKAVIANSNDLKKAAYFVNPKIEYDVIPNGVDASFFRPSDKKTKDRLRIITVARLVNWKGLEFLIDAVKEIDVELYIIGKGEYEPILKRKAGKNVKFLGYIDRNRLPLYYNDEDIFVLPSLSEGMSNSTLEAMSCGLPLILTDTGGVSNLINGNGFIINKCSSISIKNAIEKYIDNHELLKEHGEKSRLIAQKFSWESMANHYIDIYNKTLNKK